MFRSKLKLPLYHYHQLKRLADLRRCTVDDAVNFLFDNVQAKAKDWITDRFGETEETRNILKRGRTLEEVMERIQGLPPGIRPVTDGPYLEKFSFFSEGQGLIGIEAEGVKILDFENVMPRDRNVFALVKDRLPPMTEQQFRLYNTFNSQYLRLVRQPDLFTMPRIKAPAIDAGCYVGYKAFALAQFVDGCDVLAFETVPDNVEVLRLNARNNPAFNVLPIEAALSDRRDEMEVNTRNDKSMAHSLTSFSRLKEGNVSLLKGQAERPTARITTETLDEHTARYDVISALHISVNGHEPEVCLGGIETLRKSEIIRISCPYRRDERPVFDIVVDILQDNDVTVFGKSGGAVVAGRELGDAHAVPLAR